MQIRFYPNLLATERQLHRSVPTHKESECERLPFTTVLSNSYSVPHRWWHDMVWILCVQQRVRMCLFVCMRADILLDDMRHLANWFFIFFLNGGGERIVLETSHTCESTRWTVCVCVDVTCWSCLLGMLTMMRQSYSPLVFTLKFCNIVMPVSWAMSVELLRSATIRIILEKILLHFFGREGIHKRDKLLVVLGRWKNAGDDADVVRCRQLTFGRMEPANQVCSLRRWLIVNISSPLSWNHS